MAATSAHRRLVHHLFGRLFYQAVTEAKALQGLERFQSLWGKYDLVIAKSWRANWNRIKPMFELPAEIRQAVYTTHMTESLNFSLRKILKNRHVFPHDEAVYRLFVVFGTGTHQSEMDDADQKLESRTATICYLI
jgi:transposase-like protein